MLDETDDLDRSAMCGGPEMALASATLVPSSLISLTAIEWCLLKLTVLAALASGIPSWPILFHPKINVVSSAQSILPPDITGMTGTFSKRTRFKKSLES